MVDHLLNEGDPRMETKNRRSSRSAATAATSRRIQPSMKSKQIVQDTTSAQQLNDKAISYLKDCSHCRIRCMQQNPRFFTSLLSSVILYECEHDIILWQINTQVYDTGVSTVVPVGVVRRFISGVCRRFQISIENFRDPPWFQSPWKTQCPPRYHFHEVWWRTPDLTWGTNRQGWTSQNLQGRALMLTPRWSVLWCNKSGASSDLRDRWGPSQMYLSRRAASLVRESLVNKSKDLPKMATWVPSAVIEPAIYRHQK